MPVIRFEKNYPDLQVEAGANLMEQLRLNGMPVASSCQGDGICGKCRIRIVSGIENLSRVEALETLLRERLKTPPEFRISCQTRIQGDILIDAAYW